MASMLNTDWVTCDLRAKPLFMFTTNVARYYTSSYTRPWHFRAVLSHNVLKLTQTLQQVTMETEEVPLNPAPCQTVKAPQ